MKTSMSVSMVFAMVMLSAATISMVAIVAIVLSILLVCYKSLLVLNT